MFNIISKFKIKKLISFVLYFFLLIIVLIRKKTIDLLINLSKNNCDDETVIITFAGLGDFLIASNYLEQMYQKNEKLVLICKKGTGVYEYANYMRCFKDIAEYDNNYINRLFIIFKLFKIKSRMVINFPAQRHILTDIYNLSVNSKMHVLPDTLIGCNLPFLKKIVDKNIEKIIKIDSVLELYRYKEYLYNSGYIYLENYDIKLNENYDYKSKNICIFPGASGSKYKCWDIDNFIWIINKLGEEYDLNFYILGTSDEENLFYEIKNSINENINVTNLCGKLSIVEVKEYILKSRFILSNDSGGAHLGVLLNIPTIIISGVWEYGRFYPNGILSKIHKVEIIDSKLLDCSNCKITPLICPHEVNGSALCVSMINKTKVYEDCLNIMKGNTYESF